MISRIFAAVLIFPCRQDVVKRGSWIRQNVKNDNVEKVEKEQEIIGASQVVFYLVYRFDVRFVRMQ